MRSHNTQYLHHDHTFAQDQKKRGELRTLIVIGITAVMMVVEIIAGVLSGSMALLADGLHMASHAAALSLTAFAYAYARRNATNRQYSFGTGKVNALGGFASAVLLVVFAVLMGFESIVRLLSPVDIVFNQAIFVAVLGLVVNGVCVFILGVKDHDHHQEGHDHNLKAAYFHVIADALTSVLAIFALLAAKYFGLIWMDPVVGIVGAILVTRWSYGLLGTTSSVLLDRQASESLRSNIRELMEADKDTRVTDLHVWSIGPGIYSAQIAVVGDNPLSPDEYKSLIPSSLGLVHVLVEVHICPDKDCDVT